MKILCAAALMVGGVLSAGNIWAESRWVRTIDSKSTEAFVDTNSIRKVGDTVMAWYMQNFANPVFLDTGGKSYSSSKVLNYYNCSERKIATVQWITYEKEDGLGRVVSNKKAISPEYGEDPPDAASRVMLGFVCKYAKDHKV